MPMRLSGLMSNMDTESIIKDLVAVKQKKVDEVKKAQIKLQWKQDAWKDLNAKIVKLYNKTLSNMSFQSSYSKKVTKVSNPNILSVITGENAVNSVQSLEVSQLAESGYLTGAKLPAGADGQPLKASSTVCDNLGIAAGSSFTVTTGGKSTNITISADTTMANVVQQLREAGVGANFDEGNQRLFINASDSGKANDFAITASNSTGVDAMQKLGIFEHDDAALEAYKKFANMKTDSAARQVYLDSEVEKRRAYIASQKSSLEESIQKNQDVMDGLKRDFDMAHGSDSDYNDLDAIDKDALQAEIDSLSELADPSAADAERLKVLKAKMTFVDGYNDANDKITQQTITLNSITKDAAGNDYLNADGTAASVLTNEVTAVVDDKIDESVNIVNNWSSLTANSDVYRTAGRDAEISLNGAPYTSSSNTFVINGLTLTVNAKTAPGEKVTVTTMDDTDGIYDMVKNFLKEYNALINEMDKLYNAESTRGYEPLTDEEKEAISETEAEKWENKIKDSILRRDDTLNSVSSAMKEIMSSGIEVDGKTMYLADFGIETLSYFTAAENEKNAYHIAGDPDDENTLNEPDVLKGMISKDPDTVTKFFSSMAKDLRSKMQDMMQRTEYSSSFTVYEDLKMKEDYTDYTTKIAELEKKLQDYEDSWYAKFSKMETALAKMQSNMSAVTSLLGGS